MTVEIDPDDVEQADEIVKRLSTPKLKLRIFDIETGDHQFLSVDYIDILRKPITAEEEEMYKRLAKIMAEEIDKGIIADLYAQRENRTR